MLTEDEVKVDETQGERERNIVNNRFISDYQTNFVHPQNVKKRTATEIIGVNTETSKKQIQCEADAELLIKLKNEVEVLRKRSHFGKSDKENQM